MTDKANTRRVARGGERGDNRTVEPGVLAAAHETMLRIRLFEERVEQAVEERLVKGTAHSYAGQEAIAAGVCAALRPDDWVVSYHRGHGHCIAKGARLDRMMAELMGRVDGYCHGLGGSMHIADLDIGILGANGVVGAAMPIGVGAALAATLRGEDRVAVVFFGDGAANQGLFHESLNLAKVWGLPVVFVCENNQYALNTPRLRTTAVERIAGRAAGYSMPGVTVDGNDLREVHLAAREAVERARAGEGPSLIEALTWRSGHHNMKAGFVDPRSAADKAHWQARDPIVALEAAIGADGGTARQALAGVRERVEGEIADAVAFATASAEPGPEIMARSVSSPIADHGAAPAPGTRMLTYVEAIAEALHQEMARDPDVFVMGEDIGETGGIFGATKGLVGAFGEARVRDTPISESTFCGAAVGAALVGMRPVVEVQIFDFVTLMMDMLVNQAAKLRYMMGGRPTVPLVVRGPQGGGIRLAAQHSQSLETWFAHIPGLVVVAPSTPYDAKGLLTAAIRDDNPVVFLEHKLLYFGDAASVPEAPYAITLGTAEVKRPGRDVTIVAIQAMVPRALAAAQILAGEGIEAEVIDPRTIRPLDEETILESVRRTNRLVIVHEAWTRGGIGAEISAMATERAFDWLDAPILRVGAPDVPMPFNDKLERAVIPSADRIVETVRKLF